MKFHPIFKKLDYIGIHTEAELNKEQSYLQSGLDYINPKQSKITAGLIERIVSSELYQDLHHKNPHLIPIIDSRVNNVVPGIWPSVPGWHLDDCRRVNKDSQPNILNVYNEPTYHWMCLVGNRDEVSNTEFLTTKEPELLIDPRFPYKSGNRILEDNRANLSFARCPGNTIVFFNNQAWHRAMPATKHGIRLFFRLSLCYRESLNIIRTNVTNYADVEKAGW